MKIDDNHLFHGAALIQIAEDQHFTAINAVKFDGEPAHDVFRINDDIGVYLKYSQKPIGAYKEYLFNFKQEHLEMLKKLTALTGQVFLALVCVKGREICCLPYEKLVELIDLRRKAKGADEDQYLIPVTVPPGKAFRVYINAPDKKGKMLGKDIKIARKDFPKSLFAQNGSAK